MLKRFIILTVFLCSSAGAKEKPRLPNVPLGFVVDEIAREPMVRNACVLAFDQKGRLFVGQGPQWRNPKPNTPGDRVDLLLDTDGDGKLDRVKTFAKGFNCIQGLAWRGRDLWVANAPDLTIVRDLDGDDEADEYVRVYTGLGNLEHALHGLNFGPDGKLYMSKGNSKGYNRLDQLAPKPFRELWGLQSPKGAPDYTPLQTFKKGAYRRKYHTPADDWGQQGGVLRCDEKGRNLEIVSRGFRNPWDIAFDDGFNWLGTDNDQTKGDRIFMPFYGAHFGWGHSWSHSWTGKDHLPTIPVSAPLFEGSGTGVVFYNANHFPKKYRNVFFINDWLRREIYLFRPEWDGALMKTKATSVFAHADGGRSMPRSQGRVFEPTDLEVAPDGSLYVLSWGHAYGSTFKKGQQADLGRVYRIRHGSSPLLKWKSEHRAKPLAKWTLAQLFDDLASHIPSWRINAQDELLRREKARAFLLAKLSQKLTRAQETWTLWTLGRIKESIEKTLSRIIQNEKATENRRIQAIRILAFRIRELKNLTKLPETMLRLLSSSNPRLRFEAVQAIWQADQRHCVSDLLKLASSETDRLTFYSIWNALRDLAPKKERKAWLKSDSTARLVAMLGLLAEGELSKQEVSELESDEDPRIVNLARLWLKKPQTVKITPSTYRHRVFIKNVKAKSGRAYHIDWTGLAPGKYHYTDRKYRIKNVPPELFELPFMQTANADDRTKGEDWLSFESEKDVTVFVGVDVRLNAPLKWMKSFTDTGLTLETDDPTFKIYKKNFPAGRIVLGGNLNVESDSRRGNYIVIFQREILDKDPKRSLKIADVLTALKTADAGRGRELFLHPRGAGCYKCHQMEGRGRVLAPDLSDIGSRVKEAKTLIESILTPSAAITEGFAQQKIETTRGKFYTGAVLEETSRSLNLVDSQGKVTTIQKSDIESRESTKTSPMPTGFDKQMSAQQLADVVAWLRTKKVVGDPGGFSFQQKSDRLIVRLNNKPIMTYLKKHPQLTRRAFIEVRTPSGIQVTRPFPPKKGDHALMHPGLWIGFGDVNGNDYWRLRAKVVFDKFVGAPVGKKDTAEFTTRNRYLSRDGSQIVCEQTTRYRYRRVDQGILMRIDATFQSNDRDFYFGDQEESGLAVRVIEAIRVAGGNGTIVNSLGDRNGQKVWGKQADWVDYFGKIDNRHVGVMIVPSPKNARKSWMHARDYGVVVVNPFPRQPRERREPYVKTWVKKGKPYRLSYAVLIHETAKELDRKKAYQMALKSLAN